MNSGSSAFSSTWKIQERLTLGYAAAKSVNKTSGSCGARNMHQGSRFNLEDVVRHLLGRDASSGWMYTSRGVPLKASADRRGENLAVTKTKCQRTNCVQRSHIKADVVDIGGLGNEKHFYPRQIAPEFSHPQSHVCPRCIRIEEPNPPAHLSRPWIPIGSWSRFFFRGHEIIKFISVNFPTYAVRSLLNVPRDSLMAMVSLAFDARLKNGTPIFT